MKTCGKCKHCRPERSCGCDCKCSAKSDGVTFEVSRDDDIRFYGEKNNEPCKMFSAR